MYNEHFWGNKYRYMYFAGQMWVYNNRHFKFISDIRSNPDFSACVTIQFTLEKRPETATVCLGFFICVYNISSASYTSCSLAGSNTCILARQFPHLLHAFTACALLETHGDIHTNYQHQSGIFGVAICISCCTDFQTSWSEVWLSCSCSVCGSVCLDLCLDVNVKKAKHLLSVSVSGHSCLNKLHFKDCWLPTPPQEKVIIGVAYDCVEKMVYWTEITSPSISKASIQGGEPISVIRSGSVHFTGSPSFSPVFVKQRNRCLNCDLPTDLDSPEGIAIDHLGRTVFWTDSVKDSIEVASLDGSQRRVIVDSDLVNPRAIITDPPNGCVLFQMKLTQFH